MRNPVFRPGNRVGRALALALGSALLAGCQAKDPVAVGQELADRLCQQHAKVAELHYRADAQLLAEMKAGAIKTRQQYQERSRMLKRELYRQDSLSGPLAATALAEMKADFASPADQAVVAQQVLRLVDRCDSVTTAEQQRRPSVNLFRYIARLAGPDPSALDPGGATPPALRFDTLGMDSAPAPRP